MYWHEAFSVRLYPKSNGIKERPLHVRCTDETLSNLEMN